MVCSSLHLACGPPNVDWQCGEIYLSTYAFDSVYHYERSVTQS